MYSVIMEFDIRKKIVLVILEMKLFTLSDIFWIHLHPLSRMDKSVFQTLQYLSLQNSEGLPF